MAYLCFFYINCWLFYWRNISEIQFISLWNRWRTRHCLSFQFIATIISSWIILITIIIIFKLRWNIVLDSKFGWSFYLKWLLSLTRILQCFLIWNIGQLASILLKCPFLFLSIPWATSISILLLIRLIARPFWVEGWISEVSRLICKSWWLDLILNHFLYCFN